MSTETQTHTPETKKTEVTADIDLPASLEPIRDKLDRDSIDDLDGLNSKYHKAYLGARQTAYKDFEPKIESMRGLTDEAKESLLKFGVDNSAELLATEKINDDIDAITKNFLAGEDPESEDYKDLYNEVHNAVLSAAKLKESDWIGKKNENEGAKAKKADINVTPAKLAAQAQARKNNLTAEDPIEDDAPDDEPESNVPRSEWKDISDGLILADADQPKPEPESDWKDISDKLILGGDQPEQDQPEAQAINHPAWEVEPEGPSKWSKLKEKFNRLRPSHVWAEYNSLSPEDKAKRKKALKWVIGSVSVAGAVVITYGATKGWFSGDETGNFILGEDLPDNLNDDKGNSGNSGVEQFNHGDAAYDVNSGEGFYETMGEMKGLGDLSGSQKKSILDDIGPKLADMKSGSGDPVAYKMGNSWGLNYGEGKMPQKALDLIREAATKRGFLK